ncbi:hypothetical protein OS493_024919 [Desmophyllum pertusum]|uniref:Uncharacterized protein n=1 Tax=Desmophyllum pertusum TaxID=174260 RepID=A0A9X0CLB8_9CNID|nr:hypothetical protein OS493_024919 [Desmophyllum pertusum]
MGIKNKHNSLKKLLELQPSEKTRREHPCRHSVILVVKPVGAPRKNFQGRCCHLKYFWCFYWLYVHTVLYGRVPRETACPISRDFRKCQRNVSPPRKLNDFLSSRIRDDTGGIPTKRTMMWFLCLTLPIPSVKRDFNKGIKALESLVDKASPDTHYAAIMYSDKANCRFHFYRPYGSSNMNIHLTLYRAFQLKSLGVEMFVIGVGNYMPGIQELVGIASSTDRHLFRVRDAMSLLDIARLIPPWKYLHQHQLPWVMDRYSYAYDILN